MGWWTMGWWATSNSQPTNERERRKRDGRVRQHGVRQGMESLVVRGVELLVLGLTHFAAFVVPTCNSRQALACLLPPSLPYFHHVVATQSLPLCPPPSSTTVPSSLLTLLPPPSLSLCTRSPIDLSTNLCVFILLFPRSPL
jgi:hypothetical protein